MLDHLPSPVHTFPYHNTNPYPVLDPARPRHSFIVAPQEYPYADKPASRPEQSLSPLTDSDTDRPFAYNAPRDSDLDTRAFLHRPSSHSPNLSPPPLSASSSETHNHHPYSYDTRAYPDFEHSENALDSDRLPSLVSSGPPFTVSPLTSQPHTFAHSSSLDRRLSEPAIRSLYTTQPHHSLRPNQLPPLNHPSEQNVQPYSSSPPTHTVSYSHQRVSSDSSGSFSNPWPEKYPHPPPVSSDESDLANPAPIVLGSYDPHPDKHEESLSPSLDPASYPAMSDTELDLDEKLEKDADGKDKKTYSFVSLPGNAVKKRPRRRYDEIDRLYQCNFPNCSKAYGTLNHLNAHVTMQKHGQKRSPAEFKELRKQWRQQKKEADEAERQREREQRHMNAYALQHNTSSHHLTHPHINPSHHLSHPHAHLTHPSQLSRIAGMQQQPSGYPFGQRMFPRGIAGSMPGMPGVNTSPVRLYAPSPYSQQGQPQSPPDSLSSPTFIGDVYAQQQQQEGFDAYHSQILRRSSMGDFGNVGEDGVGPMRQAPQARTRRLSLHPYAQGGGASLSSPIGPERYFAASSSAPSAGLSGRFAQQQGGEQPQGEEEYAHYTAAGAVGVRRPPQGAGGIDMVSSSPTNASLSMVGGVGMGTGGGGGGNVGGWGMRSAPATTTTFAFTIPDQPQGHSHPSHPHAHSNPHAHTHPHAQQQHEGPSPPGSSHGLPSHPSLSSHPHSHQTHPHPQSTHPHQQHPHPGQSNTPPNSNSNGEPLLTSHVALGSNRLPLNSTLLTPLPGFDDQQQQQQGQQGGSRPGTGRSDLSAGEEFERQQQQQMAQVGYWREREEF